MKNNSAKVLRALRKYFGITQVNFYSLIGVSQSALSKIEAGTLELSAFQWIIVCDKFNVDSRSLFTGKIEHLSGIGSFKISQQHSHQMTSNVRTAYSLIRYMYIKLGEKMATIFLRSTWF